MKVILLKDLAKKGRKNDVIEVTDGYALNFLIPHKYAQVANARNLAQLAKVKAQASAAEAKLTAQAVHLKELVEAHEYEFAVKTHKIKVFGSITPKQIVAKIAEKTNEHFDPKQIKLVQAINTLGKHKVILHLAHKETAHIIIKVIAEVHDSN